MSEIRKGTLQISKKLKDSYVKVGIMPFKISPEEFEKLDISNNGKDCTFILENNIAKNIVIEKVLPKQNIKKINSEPVQTEKNSGSYNKGGSWNQNINIQTPDSFDRTRTKLPQDTRDLNITQIDNFALKLNKAVRFDEKGKAEFFKKGDKNNPGFEIKENFENIYFQKILKRQENSIKTFVKTHKSIELKNDWKMVVGLGGASVYETSMTLHHIYGIPYIPASTIKGITRSWIISELFENSEDKALQNEDFCYLFGSPKKSALGDHQGSIVFFDAFPLQKPVIVPDIMNPHFGDYYQGKKLPVDYLSPVPIPFLTLKETSFKIFVGSNQDFLVKDFPKTESKPLLDLTIEWIEKALTEHGVGAKTAVGYGYMSKV